MIDPVSRPIEACCVGDVGHPVGKEPIANPRRAGLPRLPDPATIASSDIVNQAQTISQLGLRGKRLRLSVNSRAA